MLGMVLSDSRYTIVPYYRASSCVPKTRYLLRDRDHAFDHVKTIGIQEVLTAPGSPWPNAYVERFIGSVRRECLDHVIVLTAAGLRRMLNEYVTYYSRTRTYLGLDKDAPFPRPIAPSGPCDRHSTGRRRALPLRARGVASPRPCHSSAIACGADVRSFWDSE